MLPAAGWHTIAAEVAPSPANAGKGHDRFACVANDLEPEWSNLGDVEVVVTHLWSMSRLPIAAIEPNPADPATRIASLAGRTASPAFWSTLPTGNRFLVENVREALGEPGSWYLDRPTGALTYCPRDGEAPDTAVVIAPVLDRLVELRGDAASGRHVAHLRFEGLTFAHGNWTTPAEGQSFPQADVNVGGSIVATGARHVTFAGCCVRPRGPLRGRIGAGCSDCSLEQCDLVDLGGGGALIGTSGGPNNGGQWQGGRGRGDNGGQDAGGRGRGDNNGGQWQGGRGRGDNGGQDAGGRGRGDNNGGDGRGRGDWNGGRGDNNGGDGRGRGDWNGGRGDNDGRGRGDWNDGRGRGDRGDNGWRTGRGRDFAHNDWDRGRDGRGDRDRYNRWRHNHHDWDRPRYRDWRSVRYGYYFDRSYSLIFSGFFGTTIIGTAMTVGAVRIVRGASATFCRTTRTGIRSRTISTTGCRPLRMAAAM